MADKNKIENEVVEANETAKAAKPAKVATKPEEKKENFFKRAFESIKKFFKSNKSELKKITWFSRKQTFTSTLLVLVCMVISAAFIGVLDLGFSKLIEGLAALVGLFR